MFGGGDYEEMLPPHSFIDALKYPDPADLADHLYSLLLDPGRFSSYFRWRPHYDILSHQSVPDNCDLCTGLVSGELARERTYPDMWDWLVRRSGCVFTRRAWDLQRFMQLWRTVSEKRAEVRV